MVSSDVDIVNSTYMTYSYKSNPIPILQYYQNDIKLDKILTTSNYKF